MAEDKMMRLSQVAKTLNVGISTVVGHLSAKGFKVENNPNTKINAEQLEFLSKDFKTDVLTSGARKEEAAPIPQAKPVEDSPILYFRDPSKSVNEKAPIVEKQPEKVAPEPERYESSIGLKVVGKIDLDNNKPTPAPVVLAPPVAVVPAPPVAQEAEKPPVSSVPKPVAIEPVVEKEKVAEPVTVAAPTVIQAPIPEVKQEVVKPIEKPEPVAEITSEPKQNVAIEEPKPVIAATPKPQQPQPVRVETPKPAPVNQPTKQFAEKLPKSDPQLPQPQRRHDPPAPVRPKDKESIEAAEQNNAELIEAKADPLRGLKILGKIELPTERKPGNGGGSNADRDRKRKRKRLKKGEKVVEAPRTGTPTDRPRSDQRTDSRAPANANGTPNATNRSNTGTGNTGTNGNRNTNTTSTGTGNNNRTGTPNSTGSTTAPTTNNNTGGGANKKGGNKKNDRRGGGRRDEISTKEVNDSIKATFARLSGGTSGKNFGADKRREKRKMRAEAEGARLVQEEEDAKTLKVTEFISANDLSSLMDVSVTEVISVCLSMGMFVSINQRLDAESITLIADEFGYDVQFISAEEEDTEVTQIPDNEADLVDRAPVVTIMGHVDHGKTSLLDYIRRTRVAAGEAGGITQHIGAYSVKTESDRMITFLDTPGHEAFTAMRARGAKVTDVVIIVIAADDSVMPQTREAINHAQNAGVPIVFAFSKVDRPGANTEKIREALSGMNILVEEWGGKYQTQEISSKSGLGISDLLEKVLLETDLLELKANPSRNASGTIIEASLDKGRGYLTTVLVQNGSLKVGDVMLAGAHFGKVKAMFDSRGERVKQVGPSTPVQLLGLAGAPQAGDKFNVMDNEREARDIANKREQIIREQTIRTRKHITLEEIGRRKAIGNFKELNVIVKGDFDGSVEALSDSLLKLSNEEVQVNIINKAVGQIAESDINLAIASDAVIVGFQVRPTQNAKKLADQEQIEIRLYSIIYDAINDVKDAIAGMLEPTIEEVITGNIEVRETFKITKVGTVAGCYVTDGIIKRNNKIRVVRDFIVVHEGDILTLKRFKDDVNEVRSGYECGLSIKGFNDLLVGDIIEGFETKEVKRTL
jgi:translation initiation factor IF-2